MIPSDEKNNQKVLLEKLNEKQKEFKKNMVILMDGDQTLCETDTSSILNKYAQIDGELIKKGFIQHNYEYPGFKIMAEIYSQLKIKDYLNYAQLTAPQVDLYPGVSDFIQNVKAFADISLLTSGHKVIWEKIFQRYNLDITIFSGIHAEIDEYIVGRNEKGLICQYFNSLGKIVVALGDSGADILMLKNADHAIIVVNDENNSDLIPYLTNHPSLFQISFKNYQHKNIPVLTFQALVTMLKELNNSKTRT
ncbi:MAG: HAD family hydrolase [Promethearchaeota archaeon]